LAGRAVFLLGGGPSANDLPLERLRRRGVWSLAVNNMAGHRIVRPQAFVCSDPPSKFSHSIWFDPGIMKFVPVPKLSGSRGKLREKKNGQFFDSSKKVCDCPNVWGFERESWLSPDDSFFLSEKALWGNHDSGVRKTGQPKTVCTVLLALRILYYLGARRIFLVGVDFRMSFGKGYAFEQDRTKEAVESNNNQFSIVNKWLCEMEAKGVFKRFGLEIYNCYQFSGLRAFPFVPFSEALEVVTEGVEEFPDLSGWYEK